MHYTFQGIKYGKSHRTLRLLCHVNKMLYYYRNFINYIPQPLTYFPPSMMKVILESYLKILYRKSYFKVFFLQYVHRLKFYNLQVN